MGWLASPLWMVPIRTFVDNNCVIFDQEEEHKLEYTIVHMKFKELVETLLENFLSDIEISNDQFGRIMTSDIEIERGNQIHSYALCLHVHMTHQWLNANSIAMPSVWMSCEVASLAMATPGRAGSCTLAAFITAKSLQNV